MGICVPMVMLLKASQGWKWVYTRSSYAALMLGKAANEKSNSAEQDEQSPSNSSTWRWGQGICTHGEKRGILWVKVYCHFYSMTSLFFPSVLPASGFEWGTYLENETSLAASVSCFRHVSPDCVVELEIVPTVPIVHTFSGFISNVFIPTGDERIVSSLARKQADPLDCIQVEKYHLLWRMNFITTHKWNPSKKQLHLSYILLDLLI